MNIFCRWWPASRSMMPLSWKPGGSNRRRILKMTRWQVMVSKFQHTWIHNMCVKIGCSRISRIIYVWTVWFLQKVLPLSWKRDPKWLRFLRDWHLQVLWEKPPTLNKPPTTHPAKDLAFMKTQPWAMWYTWMDFAAFFAIDYGMNFSRESPFVMPLGKHPETAGRAVYCWFVMLREIADRMNISVDRISLSLGPLGVLFSWWVWGHLNPSPWLSSGRFAS